MNGELSFEAPSKRQTAADMGHDFAGLSKPEITTLFVNSSEEIFATVKPWVAEIHRPLTAPEELDYSAPDEALRLQWLYGIRK